MTTLIESHKKPNHKEPKKSFSRFVEKPQAWIAIVLLLFAIPLYFSFSSPQPKLPPVLGQISNFSLVNQEGRAVSYETDFKGSVLLVNFIFTSCPDVCPLLTKQMEKVQNRLITAAPYIRLISISVDPETDTPQVLKDYGLKFGARFKSWSFLTGDLMEIYNTVVNGFKVAMEHPGLDSKAKVEFVRDPKTLKSDDITYDLLNITHGEHFVLVDQAGQIRAYMKGNNDQEINKIIHTLGLLANTNPAMASAL
jgi:protein SCO1/2